MPEGEAPQALQERTKPEAKTEDLSLWQETIQREARSLLEKYLPDALPQEPTKIVIENRDYRPGGQYLGSFNNKHYLTVGNSALDIERARKIIETPDEELDKLLMETEELIKEIDPGISDSAQEPEKEKPEAKSMLAPGSTEADLEWIDGLKKGPDNYSFYTWVDIQTAVHEMIHQRQAELNPTIFPTLNFDPQKVDAQTLSELINTLYKQSGISNTSLNNTVEEGMATVGSYYVMAELEKGLTAAGKIETANRVRKVRKSQIHHVMHPMKNLVGGPETNWKMHYEGILIPYDQHYIDGVRMMRNLYKRLGFEGTIKFLQSVDLAACQGIVRDTPEFQKFMDDPTALPRINSIAA